MQIQRFPNRRRASFGCGCVTLLTLGLIAFVGLLLLWPALPGIALRFAGFAPSGETSQVFTTQPPPPAVSIQNSRAAGFAQVDAGRYGQFDLSAAGVSVSTGQSAAGDPLATVTLSEAELLTLCRQYTQICATGDSRVRNASVDLRPGGAVVYAEVMVPQVGIWQRMGVVLRLDSQGTRLNVMGVDVDGVLYEAPPEALGISIQEIEATANDAIRQAALQTAGGRYRVAEIYADERELTVMLR